MTQPGEPGDPRLQPDRPSRGFPLGRGLLTVVAVLAATSLLLAWRNQLPAPPVLILVILGLGSGLWWLADHGGRHGGSPVAAPVEALLLIAAVAASIVVFWVVFGWLE
jgi:hypothetical protein